MAVQLTEGALAVIMKGGDYTDPVLQVLGVKKLENRYRVQLSDGKYIVSLAIMTDSVYDQAGENGLPKYSILKIISFQTDVIINAEGKYTRVMLIFGLEVLKDGSEVGQKIGNPIPYTSLTSSDALRDKASTSGSINTASSCSSFGGSEPAPKKSKLINSSVGGIGEENKSLSKRVWRPISSLNEYQKKWTIKAKVLYKSPIKLLVKANRSGKFCYFFLVDESGETICSAFNEHADKYYDMIKVDMVYWISNCDIKIANKNYSNYDYELSIGNHTKIEECHDADISKLQIQYNFVDISKISDLDPGQIVDIIGVATETEDIEIFQTRSTGKEIKKRDIELVDQSNAIVTLTLWEAEAENFDGTRKPVIALKGAMVNEFLGCKCLKIVSGTMMRINPEIEEYFRLKQWYEVEATHVKADDISSYNKGNFNVPWKCFKEMSHQQLESINYYQVKGTFLFLKTENCVYKACPSDRCYKKVIDNNDGTYRCERCNKNFENFEYKLLGNMKVGDWSGHQWITMYGDQVEKVVGMTAKEAEELLNTNPSEFNEKMIDAYFSEFILKCRVRMETYNDEQRLNTVAVRVDPINYAEYNTYLINNIKRLTNKG